MADNLIVISASSLIYTGQGQIAGFILTASAGNPLATFYDNTAGSGSKILEVYGSYLAPVIILFPEKFMPAFTIGLYLSLAANLTATVWTRQL